MSSLVFLVAYVSAHLTTAEVARQVGFLLQDRPELRDELHGEADRFMNRWASALAQMRAQAWPYA